MNWLGRTMLMILLLTGSSMGQELWNLGSSQDWLSAGPIYSMAPYYYHPYPYDQLSGFAKLYAYDYASPFYFPSYYFVDPKPYYTEFWAQAYPGVWWVGYHQDLGRTLDIARTGSSFRIYRGGVWQPP